MKRELTLREVIANIKQGEIWENEFDTIKYFTDGIVITRKEKIDSCTIFLNINSKFKLKNRKDYSFQEALRSFKEGKEIESCVSGGVFDCKLGHIMKNYDHYDSCENLFSFNEVEGRWYIND